METEHFTYDDVDVYREDANLFLPGRWLNTNCVHFGLRLLEHESFYLDGKGKDSILIFDPSQVSFIRFQLESDEEMADFRGGNNVDSVRWIFAPVNNNESLFEMGSHWSFMAYHVTSSTAIHLDSMRGNNADVARELAKKLDMIVSVKTQRMSKFIPVSPSVCPQQQDGCNCGIYTLLFAGQVARAVLRDGVEGDKALIKGDEGVWARHLKDIDGKSPMAYREFVREIIKGLS